MHESPETAEMAAAMERAREREWIRLALAAGLANDQSPAAAEAGRRVEALARRGPRAPGGRRGHRDARQDADQGAGRHADQPVANDGDTPSESFVDRIKAVSRRLTP